MKLTDDSIGATIMVRAYSPGELRIGESVFQHSCLLSGDQIVQWRPRTFNQLTLEDLNAAIALKPEIVVLGTGGRQRFPDRQLMAAMLSRGIGFEVMDTGAACRTYNILVSEDRRVVAALLLHDD
jgi:uncharacterized protein